MEGTAGEESTMTSFQFRLLHIGFPLSFFFVAATADGQDDGARAYQVAPAGIRSFSVYGIFTRGNKSLDPGSVVTGANIDVNVSVFQFAHPLVLGTRLGGIFLVAPVGQVVGTLSGSGTSVSGRSSGLGDIQVGWIQNIVGPPAATGEDFISLKPGFTLSALTKVTAPTGDYTSARIINLGANRWAAQLGAPMAYYIGGSFADARLTTFELLPSITVFSDNADPNGAEIVSQKPLLRLEGHVTHNLTRKLWVSFDGLYNRGAETTTDRVKDENKQASLALGGTAGVTVSPHFIVKATYGGVVARNASGGDGHMFRIIGSIVF
jgi:hypothetical protein